MPHELTPAMRVAMERKATLRVPGGVTSESKTKAAVQTDWTFTIPGEPMGKPRMTRRDVWKKRKCVMEYRAWADLARLHAPKNLPEDPAMVSWNAWFPMPASWSQKKRAAMAGQLHRQKPDRDNIDKALLDALWKRDEGVAGGMLWKYWDDGSGARIEVTVRTVALKTDLER